MTATGLNAGPTVADLVPHRPRTPEEARAALQRLIGAAERLRRDDVSVLADALAEWEQLRAGGRELLPEVAAFAVAMDAKIRAHDHDRGEYGWRTADARQLLAGLDRYVRHLRDLVWSTFTPTPKNAREKAANVANLAMMIADVYGAFREEPPRPEPDCPRCHRPMSEHGQDVGAIDVVTYCPKTEAPRG